MVDCCHHSKLSSSEQTRSSLVLYCASTTALNSAGRTFPFLFLFLNEVRFLWKWFVICIRGCQFDFSEKFSTKKLQFQTEHQMKTTKGTEKTIIQPNKRDTVHSNDIYLSVYSLYILVAEHFHIHHRVSEKKTIKNVSSRSNFICFLNFVLNWNWIEKRVPTLLSCWNASAIGPRTGRQPDT